MKRLATMAAMTVLAIGTLTACGGDDDSDGASYCDQVKDAQDQFSGLEDADITLEQIDEQADVMGDIAESAPDAVADKWRSAADLMDQISGILDDAGYQDSDTLASVGSDQDVAQKLSELDLQGIQSDMTDIQDNVKDECDIELGDSE